MSCNVVPCGTAWCSVVRHMVHRGAVWYGFLPCIPAENLKTGFNRLCWLCACLRYVSKAE